ncbi:conserved hypothetical protein [Chlamydia pneumoniae LPCoLN]|uniref:DUF2608 domain-containing protein n=1 Tax=Chlamydia pneumoniae TaxID=83558 RepID=UPI0001BD9E77|nr:DUF2608 domain-containing protein [Chlamydia pneumoniae]ACZ32974.1 conserved hypothetical protein [Chlamydia pneumoniae LPCoLN]ETR79865.1 putative outer membrane protein [Chlamydia pneumoniae B21]
MLKIQKKRMCVSVVITVGAIVGFFNSADAAPKKKKIPIQILYSFTKVSSYLKNEDASTIFCVDVDRGLLQHRYLGSPGWQETRRRQLFKSLENQSYGNERLGEETLAIDIFRNKECLESEIPEQMEAILANSSALVLGISSFGITGIPATLHSLLRQNLSFQKRSIASESFLLKIDSAPSDASVFYKGVLFRGETAIVDALSQLFAQLDLSPKKIIFLGEDPEVVRAVGSACIGWGMNFLGLVYYPAQESLFSYVHPYSTATELQEAQGLQVISDEVAQLTLNALPKMN